MPYRCLSCDTKAETPFHGMERCALSPGCGFKVGRFEPYSWTDGERQARVMDTVIWRCRHCAAKAEIKYLSCGCNTVTWLERQPRTRRCDVFPSYLRESVYCKDGIHQVSVVP